MDWLETTKARFKTSSDTLVLREVCETLNNATRQNYIKTGDLKYSTNQEDSTE